MARITRSNNTTNQIKVTNCRSSEERWVRLINGSETSEHWGLKQSIGFRLAELIHRRLRVSPAKISQSSQPNGYHHPSIHSHSGISRDGLHKRSHTGAKRANYRDGRKFELGRQPAMTKIGAKRIHEVRTRGGNRKFRALRLDTGSFSWGSECISRKTRILAVSYNSSNNELVRTNTLVKGCVVTIDSSPFRQWWENHYGVSLKKKTSTEESVKRSAKVERKLESRKAMAHVDHALEEQFSTGRLYGLLIFLSELTSACISSRPGQSGRCDGYVLEGKELEFYVKKMKAKKGGQ